MRRSTTKYVLSVGLLSFGTLALTPSCADNNSSLFVLGVIATDASACVAKNDTASPMLAAGTLDTAFATSYTAFVLVGNQLTQRGSREQLRTETSRISLRGAEVTLTTLDGKELGRYSTVGTGFIDASQGDSPAYAAMAVNVIPPFLGMMLKDELGPKQPAKVVLAKIRVFGDTLGNTSVTSSELDFPINVCAGCLVKYDTPDPMSPDAYRCPAAASSAMTTTAAAPCAFGQDKTFSCTTCAGAYPICRDPGLNDSFTKPTP